MLGTFKQHKYFLTLLFLISFLVRALVFHFYLSKNQNYFQIDSTAYHLIAKSIAQNKGITTGTGEPNFHRLPGYSIILSFIYKIFGINQIAALWIQIFLASFIPILIFFLSLTFFPTKFYLAEISSIYSSIHLGLLLYSGFFMTESLFIFLFLLFCIIFFGRKNEYNYLRCFSSGLFLGLLSMVRPVGHYLIFIFIVLILLEKNKFLEKLKAASYLFLGWFLVVLPWLIRNYLLLGHIFFHTLPGGHFLKLSAARVYMLEKKISYKESCETLEVKLRKRIAKFVAQNSRPINPIERCIVSEKLALKYFKKNPLISIKCWTFDIFRTFFSLYSAEIIYLENNRTQIDYFAHDRNIWSMISRYIFPQTKNKIIKLVLFFEIFFFLFILIGFFLGIFKQICRFILMWRRVDFSGYFYSTLLILFFIFISLAGGYARMRLPAEPFLIILSFNFWCSFLKKKELNDASLKNISQTN